MSESPLMAFMEGGREVSSFLLLQSQFVSQDSLVAGGDDGQLEDLHGTINFPWKGEEGAEMSVQKKNIFSTNISQKICDFPRNKDQKRANYAVAATTSFKTFYFQKKKKDFFS